MTRVRHVNRGVLSQAAMPRIPCHCLLLESPSGLTLVDTGIGEPGASATGVMRNRPKGHSGR